MAKTDDSEITTQSTQTVRRRGQYKHARRPGKVKLRVLDGPMAGQEREIERSRIRVGRSESADFTVDHDSLSRLHFELRLGRTGAELFDLRSKNGLYLLDRRVYHSQVIPGDEILAGRCRIVLVETSDVTVEHGVELRDDGLLGISEPILEVFFQLEKVAQMSMPVLITGPTGAGKDLFVRALHRHSPRSDKPLVNLNCAAMPESLADSELFGHRRGAFTGAEEDHAGVFEQADGGTLHLSEVGELSLAVQAKLLRVVESKQVTRLGSGQARPVDVRVVATSHRDLPRMVNEERFREDLYFRLAQMPIDLASLRERGGDEIEYLARQFLAETNKEHGKSLRLSDEVVAALRGHRWRGNVRELRSVIERLPAVCDGLEVLPRHVPLGENGPRLTQLDELLRFGTLKKIHLELDRVYLPGVLKEVGGNVSAAARLLGVGRTALQNRLKEIAGEQK